MARVAKVPKYRPHMRTHVQAQPDSYSWLLAVWQGVAQQGPSFSPPPRQPVAAEGVTVDVDAGGVKRIEKKKKKIELKRKKESDRKGRAWGSSIWL